MSEETLKVETPENTESTTSNEPSAAEQAARAQGWVPKEEWTGEGKWRDAESFLDRGELFQKIDSQRRKLRDLEENQKAFQSHLKTVREAEYKRAVAAILKEKKDALIEGDPDAVIAADEKRRALDAEIAAQERAAAQVHASNEPHPDFVAWHARNPWYSETNRAMKAFADVEGIRLQQSGLSPAEVLREIEAQVRKEFPEKFTNPNRARPGAVEAGSNKGTASSKESYQLSDDERMVMNRLVKSGTLTKEQYIADLKAAKGEK
jgi:hypothetical protein